MQAFPAPGPLVQQAYRDLELVASLNPEQLQTLGGTQGLPRPWDPASCTDGPLRRELWDWLDKVVDWYNQDHVWDPRTAIPTCWPHHPHLAHQIAVLADQRHYAGRALTSDLLEDWHRYSLPAFTDRMQSQLREHCLDAHAPWPAQGRYTQHTSLQDRGGRSDAFDVDSHPFGQG